MNYKLLKHLSYHNQFEVVNNLTKEFYPEVCPSKKVCIFCKRDESEVSFKKNAHIIPAALGNKLLFSLVECDECNQNFGDTLENDLCNDLYIIRAFSKLKKRTGYPKHKLDKSFIEFDPKENKIKIETHFDDDTIEFIPLKNNEIELKIKCPPINYINVAKAIARIGVLILPKEEIEQLDHIINWINGEIEYIPLYYKGSIPGTAFSNTEILLFKRINNTTHSKKLPLYVINFYIGLNFYIIGFPDKDFKFNAFPPILHIYYSQYPPYDPTFYKRDCNNKDKEDSHIKSFKLNYKWNE